MSEPAETPVALPPGPSRGRRITGIVIMLVGIAMTVISGLCTGVMAINDLKSGFGSRGGGGDINLSGIEFIVGGPFILVGALMWWGGARLKGRRPAPVLDPAVFGELPPSAGG